MNYTTIPSNQTLEKTAEALSANNFSTVIVENAEEAKKKALELIPEGAEVLTMTSQTLETTGIADILNNSGKYNSVRNKLNSMNRETESLEMQKVGSAPEYSIGSVHAVTEDGKILIASNSGSQLPGYLYGSPHVVFVIGAQKVVSTMDEAVKRVYDYVLPLESERAKKAYGVPGSFVSKLVFYNKEPNPTRIHVILVKEALGY